MKLPDKCPVCGDIMLTSFSGLEDRKRCTLRPTHQIMFSANSINDEVYEITILIDIKTLKWARWLLDNHKLYVLTNDAHTSLTELPFFMPNLTNYPKLLEKIKLYLLVK